jgi:starvation-inducible DNA-binding protein
MQPEPTQETPMTSTITPTPTSRRRTSVEGVRFLAPSRLVDLVELSLQGKQAHWNVVGTNFRDIHLQLDEIVDVARLASDTIAERMRALQSVPDGRTDTVVATTTLPSFPAGEQTTGEIVSLVTDRIAAAVATMRGVHDDVDDDDPASADLLHVIIDDLEKNAWMLSVENTHR